MAAWELSGRAVLITGAASGIGAELARRLAARGMRLALIDVDGERLEAAAKTLPGAQTAVADVRDAAALKAAVDDLAGRLGGLDVCVANAGVASGGPLRLVAPETVEETIDVNLLGVWRTVSAALPHVLDRRGYVLLISSAAAVFAPPGLGAYSASKAGVEALGRALRAELRPHGVQVAVAYYLFLATPMVTAGRGSPVFPGRGVPLLTRVWPLEPAIARTVRAIERRSRSVAHPPFLRGIMAVRSLLDCGPADRVTASSVSAMEDAFSAEADRIGAAATARLDSVR